MAAKAKQHQTVEELKKELENLQEKIEVLEEHPRRAEIKELFSWDSPSRTYRKKSLRWFLNLALLIAIILVILLFLKQFILMAVVLSLGFLAYVIDAVPPEEVNHRITTQGLISGEDSWLWDELYDFWFFKKHDFDILAIDTMLNFPRRIILLVPKDEEEKIKELLASYIPFREQPKQSWLDTWSEKLADQFHHLVGS